MKIEDNIIQHRCLHPAEHIGIKSRAPGSVDCISVCQWLLGRSPRTIKDICPRDIFRAVHLGDKILWPTTKFLFLPLLLFVSRLRFS